MNTVESYQQQLLTQAQHIYAETPLSEATQRAYRATPRHRFVRRYREWGSKTWREVSEDNLVEHAATLYADKSLILFGEDDNSVPSTVSQPSFVLRMLDMLRIEPGQTVFELGTGSGWNAALMGQLVGSGGHVYTVEIIPELARMAAEAMESLGISNVSVINADGGDAYAPGAPYDRAIFTAGSYDLPRAFYEQVKDGGLLLAVIKNEGGGDYLFILRKTADHFESVESMPCGFVQLTGKYRIEGLDPAPIESLAEWDELKEKVVSRTPFWWGGKGKAFFLWVTMGIRSFLGITEPTFRAFKAPRANDRAQEEHYFGLWDQANHSLVLARDDTLIAYGSAVAKERLIKSIRQWVELGMPSAASFHLRVYPADVAPPASDMQWIVKRTESVFAWRLTNAHLY
jgi:protein-L-isoaspartate(D-aspartate) O-methyltransferase